MILKLVTLSLFHGKFSLPDVARNRGGFNYRRFLNSNDIFGTIKIESFNFVKKSKNKPVYFMQNLIYDNLLKYLDEESAGILSGMIIGETSLISEETEDNFRKAGISHLLAVSGSNVAIVITCSTFIFSKIFGRKYSDYVSIAFIVFFVMVAGSSASVLRAGIMAILCILANILIKRPSSIDNVFSSVFLILLFKPLSVLNVGFILSFVGTIGIILLSKPIDESLKRFIKYKEIRETLSVTLAAQLALLPIMVFYFNTISLVSIFSNLFIIPITGVVTVIGIILIGISMLFPFLANLISLVIVPLVHYVLVMSEFFSKFDFLNIKVITPSILTIIFLYGFIFIFYLKQKIKKQDYIESQNFYKSNILFQKFMKFFYFLFVGYIFVCFVLRIVPNNYVELTAIDVGQGDSFLFITENKKVILIDGGGSESSDYDVGENILVPYLLDRGITKIDYVFVSHAHADHIEGIYSVIEYFRVNNIFIGVQHEKDNLIEKLVTVAEKYNAKIYSLVAGDYLKIDGVMINILHPSSNYYDDNINNLSLVMKIECNGRKILFTGDAEAKVEETLKSLEEIDILKVGHHGSKTSSTEEFIDKLNPKISLIGVSKNNSYGHPNKNVINRLEKKGNVFMTKDHGELNIKIYKNSEVYIFSFIENNTYILK